MGGGIQWFPDGSGFRGVTESHRASWRSMGMTDEMIDRELAMANVYLMGNRRYKRYGQFLANWFKKKGQSRGRIKRAAGEGRRAKRRREEFGGGFSLTGGKEGA